MNRFGILLLCLLIAIAQQVSSALSCTAQTRNVAAMIDGGPLKPLSFIEKSITKDIELLAKEIGNEQAPVNSLEDILVCISDADRVIEKYNGMFAAGRITRKRIDEKNSIERAAALLKALPLASETCDLVSYLDLMAIFKAAASDTGLCAANRVNSSILTALRLHRSHCSAHYYARFETALKGIDAGVKKTVAQMFDAPLIREIFPGFSQLNPELLFDAENTHEHLVAISDRLMDKLIEAQDGLSKADESQFSATILFGHLLSPCETFVEALEGILLPAKLDMALKDSDLSTIVASENQEFLNNWARFHICSAIHYNEPLIRNALKAEFKRRFI